MAEIMAVGGDISAETVADRLEAIARDIEMTQQIVAFRIGERLAEARDLFRYKRDEGGFRGWVKSRLGWSEKQAYRFINIHENLGGKCDEFVTLSREALFALAAPNTPDEVVAEVELRTSGGEKVTAEEIKELKRKLRETAKDKSEIKSQYDSIFEKFQASEQECRRLAEQKRALEERLPEHSQTSVTMLPNAAKPIAPADPPLNANEAFQQYRQKVLRAWEPASDEWRHAVAEEMMRMCDRPVMDRRYG